ncbi:MAG TPA: hypothetical protein ENK31_10315, partial [Nannocystis exedens]|nr:hypothetical protein [Nannocystis exedens]
MLRSCPLPFSAMSLLRASRSGRHSRGGALAPEYRGSLAPLLSRVVLIAGFLSTPSTAAAAPTRTRFELPASNGYSALLVDLQSGRATQLREHLFAAEEPQLDAQGEEIWDGAQFAAVYTRDLLYDAYFGLRTADSQFWLTSVPVDLDASGYAPRAAGERGGTGLVTMVQNVGAIEVSQYFFTPQALEGVGFVMA